MTFCEPPTIGLNYGFMEMIIMVLFPNFDRGPTGSLDEHHRLLAKYGYRYYCPHCVKNIESKGPLEQCNTCGGPLQMLMSPKAKQEGFFQKFHKYFQQAREKKSKEEMPTG